MTTKFLLALKICKSAANVIFFFCGNSYLSIDVTKTFSQRGRHKSKKGKRVVLRYHKEYKKSKISLGLFHIVLA